MNRSLFLCSVCVVCLAAGARAQVANPAETSAQRAEQQPVPTDRPRTWQMPPVDVYGKAPLDEEDRIGDYAQPRWTAHRLFSETRVYVIPRGMADFEYWLIPETSRNGDTVLANQFEVEFGLGHRLQLDLYAVSHKSGGISGPLQFDQQKAELRYAFADWGKIWGNPTMYLEWVGNNNQPDRVEAKLLFGGQIASGWHWGSNIVWDHQLGGARENSDEWTVGISHTVRDSRLELGLETQFALVNAIEANGRRPDFDRQFLIGPSLQLRPLPQMHIDFAPLFGTTGGSPRAKLFAIVGYEF